MKTQWYMAGLSVLIGTGVAVLAPSEAQAIKCCQGQTSEAGVGSCGVPCNFQPVLRTCNMVMSPAGFVNGHITMQMNQSTGVSTAKIFGDGQSAFSPGIRMFTMCTGDTSIQKSPFGWPAFIGGVIRTRTCPGTSLLQFGQCQAQAANDDPNAFVMVNGVKKFCTNTCE